ncbi:MAG: GGDEF domain-containing protein [Acidimicrobiia bacterium]|nr:GGDEF domain-containing protein [Acidimicrobiia bacterium]
METAQEVGRRERLGRLGPFAAIAILPLLLASISLVHPWALGIAVTLTLTVALSIVLVSWENLDWRFRVIPVVLYCAAVGLARHAEGGGSSSLTLLLLLPVLWQALYGERPEVVVALLATSSTLVIPVVLVGEPEYPPDQWKTVAVWLIVAPAAGWIVHKLVDRLRVGETTLARIAHVAHNLTTAGDNRECICRAAIEVAGADLAYLLEQHCESCLASTAVAGVSVPPFEIEIGQQPSTAVDVYLSGTPKFVADTASTAVSQKLVQLTGARTAYFQPVLRGQKAVGVLVVAWRTPRSKVTAATTNSLALLATEAAMAMERADQLSEVSRLARIDPLTGLPNRRSWDEEAGREVAARRRSSEPLVLAIVDIDLFKDLNDRLGHQAGDLFLKEAAAAWRSTLRQGDFLARWGGEEFAVLLPNCTGARAFDVLERLRACTPRDQSCSVGIVEVTPDDTLESAVERADAALYQAKDSGRDRSQLHGVGGEHRSTELRPHATT